MLTPVEETMRALDDQVRAGKVLYVGVSDWYAWEVAQANTLATLRGWTAFSGLQVPYSLGERTVERELVPMAAQLGLAVTAWSPLGGGRLARGSKDPLVGALKNVAGEIGARATQVAIAWLRRRSGRVIPIIGVSKAEQMRENLGALDIELSTDHLAELDKASSIELGFPGDFLADMQVRDAVYGSHRARIGEGM
ncbi:aryl-alcohol dehydrogenase-like predicted oxidoreductase [Haloactinomyces albus]|uniref:Aryl-alcohol dehydrogenase-like predicted oxidoreductase n=2 Tax=Haloactinomyces albus TaxID=1352928 RepID=A0AAE3ZKP6_9ACTN|nr:aryl-alcohol dehydrogenase-like predicted oxidoreductase [Haloactinomyces albus]